MIKTSELRIGNLYFEFGIPKQATAELILKLKKIEEAGKVAIDISSIPLTPEWLERAGFENVGSKTYEQIYSYGHGYMIFRVMFHDKGYWIILQDTRREKDGVNFGMDYNYVHELQNTWKDIVKTELEIKEPQPA